MLANDVAAAKAGYGPYVEPISADVGGGGGLPRALRNVKCVVALGRLGKLLPAAKQAGVEHIVLLSTAGARMGLVGAGSCVCVDRLDLLLTDQCLFAQHPARCALCLPQPTHPSSSPPQRCNPGMPQLGALAALFGGGGDDPSLREEVREQQLAASGLPHVIVKAGPIQNVPGGSTQLTFKSSGGGKGGGQGLSREDLARVLAGLVLDVSLPAAAAATVVVESAGPGAPPADLQAALRPLLV